MTATVAGIHLGLDTHANRPAANTVPDGSIYSCSTHSLVYKSNFAGNSWATWATLGGTGLSDPMTTRGDIIVRDASNTTARLAVGAAGTVLGRSGSDALYVFPPGYQYDYSEITTPVTVSGTAETSAGSTLVITGNAATYDGAAVVLEFFSPGVTPGQTAGNDVRIGLFESTTFLGRLGLTQQTVNGNQDDYKPMYLSYRFTPSAASHTYLIRAMRTSANGTIQAGAAGATNYVPAFLRITKA